MRIVLLGAPGSGKRTQTQLIVDKYGIPAICTGELLKDAVTKGTELGLQVKEAMDSGHSVTEEVVLELIHERLLLPDAQQGFVLDGFPRNILQAITLDELLIEINQPLELALLIDIETDALMERMVGRRSCKSCGMHYNIFIDPTAVEGVCDMCGGQLRHRADDNEETISSRLHIYDHLAAPLIKHYSKQHKLQQVDGFGEIDEVFTRICEVMDTHEPPAQAVVFEPVATSIETDLPPVPDAEPMKQLIPTGLETSARTPASTIERAIKKRAQKKSKAAAAKKTPVKKAAGGKKQQTAKKVAQKKKAAATKKTAAKKKVAKKKSVASKKKAIVKKKVSLKKKVATKNTATQKKVAKKKATKKKVVKKAIVQKKRPIAKKKAVPKKTTSSSKKSLAKKKSVTKKKVSVKKKQAKKKLAKKTTKKKRS